MEEKENAPKAVRDCRELMVWMVPQVFREIARRDLCRGRRVTGVPTVTASKFMQIVRSGLIGFSEDEQRQFSAGELQIHRIFRFDRFIDLLRNQQLALLKPSVWEDPFENPLHRMVLEGSTGRNLSLPHFEKNLFAQCWSLTFESDALWRIYSPGLRGVLVTACAKKLLEQGSPQFEAPMEQVFLGKVQYHTQDELKQMLESQEFLRSVLRAPKYSHGSPSVLLHKRDSFKHEAEVRLVLSRHISEVSGDVAIINLPLSEVVLKVTLDPRLSDVEFDRMCYLINKSGFYGAIEQSSLYATPELNLEIPSLEWLYEDGA